jgi:hypothetical protein
MFSFLRPLLTRRAWMHAWREHDDLHRECMVCGQQEERDADGDWMCNGPGPWWVAHAGKRTAHFRQQLSGRVADRRVDNDSSRVLAHDIVHELVHDEHAV